MICNPSSGQLSNPINFSFFNAATNQFVRNESVAITNQYTLSKTYDEPCITGNEVGCKYTIVIYDLASVELPALPEGYIVSYQRCCRIAGINNLVISGIAPTMVGQYVICVCVNEYRNGTLIATTRKELHLEVSDCSPLRAQLNPRPSFCDDLNVSFQNDAAGNPANADYLWDFGDPASGANNTSTLASTSHIFSAPGDYNVKLRVTLQGICSDSSTTVVRVWPGFYPGFTTNGICVLTPYQFTDTTRVTYGTLDYWHWNFGDNSTLADTSRIRNPQYNYPGPGPAKHNLVLRKS